MTDRKENFKIELQDLLKKYHAELAVEEIGSSMGGYGPGEHKLIATFETVISDDGTEILETFDELDLGTYLCGE